MAPEKSKAERCVEQSECALRNEKPKRAKNEVWWPPTAVRLNCNSTQGQERMQGSRTS